jgi:hypothetical protein
VLATAFTGIIEEHQLGHAFSEALPFTATRNPRYPCFSWPTACSRPFPITCLWRRCI